MQRGAAMSDDDEAVRPFTDQEKYHLFRATLEKLHEFDLRDLDADVAAWADRDAFERLYSTLAWEKRIEYQFAARQAFRDRYEDERGRLRLVAALRGDQLGLPAALLPDDVTLRRARYISAAAERLGAEIDDAINLHGVTSPIEQIFLMEWKFQEGALRHNLTIEPQFRVQGPVRAYVVDFRISRKGSDLSLCVELDGHDFHEKTPGQAAADKQRDRALLGLGHQTIRFTGAEVVRDSAACVDEILRLAEQRGTP